MRNDSRLSRMLHVLIHMDKHQHASTSDMIAKMLNTNPVVVRRTMAGLREQGYVRSEKGHGGGWTLVRPLSEEGGVINPEVVERITSVLRQRSPSLAEPEPAA